MSAKMTSLRYKCRCMSEEITFDVPARRKHEDIADWMEKVRRWLGEDHSLRSPFCRSGEVEYLKIPVPEDGRAIGSSPKDAN